MATRPILFAEHALLRFGGGLGADTWSCGIRLAGSPASSDTAFCEDNIDDAADAVQTWWTGSVESPLDLPGAIGLGKQTI